VVEKLGVTPRQVVDLLALMGDSVDNIPGVKGVGKKTAVALLQAFESLDNLYARLDEVADLPLRGAKSLADKLTQQKETAWLSQRLAKLAYDAPATATVEELVWSEPHVEAVEALRRELGFDPLRSGRRGGSI
jgi:DNA polymerase-1